MNPINQKSTNINKIGGLFPVIICLVSVAMFGCSKPGNTTTLDDFSNVNISEMINMNKTFNLPLPEDNNDDGRSSFIISPICRTLDKQIVIGRYEDKLVTFKYYDLAGNVIKQVAVDVAPEESINFTVDQNGDLIVLHYDYKNQNGVLKKYLEDDSNIHIMTIKDIEFEYIDKIKIDNRETLYIYDYETFGVFSNGKKLDIDEKREIDSMAVDPDGILYYTTWENKKQINVWNSETKKSSHFETPLDNLFISFDDGKLYIMDIKGIKVYTDSDFKGYITCSNDYPDLNRRYPQGMFIIDKSIYITSRPDRELLLSRIDITDKKRNIDNRPSITLQVPSYHIKTFDYAAKKFNKNQNDVQIVVSQFEEDNISWRDRVLKRNTNILTGKGSDIIFLSDLPYHEYIEKGILVDINDFMDHDKSFSREDYLPALTAAENKKGLFALAIGSINDRNCLFSVEEAIMNKYGYSGSYLDIHWNNLLEIAIKERESDNNGMEIYPFVGNSLSSRKIIGVNNCFLNRESGQFEEEKFREFLNILNIFITEDLVKPDINGLVDLYSSVAEGSVIFSQMDVTELFQNLSLKKNLFNNEPIMQVHPTLGDKALYFSASLLGINSSSDYKKEAWDFLKYILSYEVQKDTNFHGISMNKQILKESTVSNLSSTSMMSIEDDSGTYEFEGVSEYTDKDLEDYYKLLEKYDSIYEGSSELQRVIYQQLEPFIDGERTLDETLLIVKDRVETYINE